MIDDFCMKLQFNELSIPRESHILKYECPVCPGSLDVNPGKLGGSWLVYYRQYSLTGDWGKAITHVRYRDLVNLE